MSVSVNKKANFTVIWANALQMAIDAGANDHIDEAITIAEGFVKRHCPEILQEARDRMDRIRGYSVDWD